MLINEILPGGSVEGTIVTDIDVVDVAILHMENNEYCNCVY